MYISYAYNADEYCENCILKVIGLPRLPNRNVEESLVIYARARHGVPNWPFSVVDSCQFPVQDARSTREHLYFLPSDGDPEYDGRPRTCGRCRQPLDPDYEPPRAAVDLCYASGGYCDCHGNNPEETGVWMLHVQYSQNNHILSGGMYDAQDADAATLWDHDILVAAFSRDPRSGSWLLDTSDLDFTSDTRADERRWASADDAISDARDWFATVNA